MRPSAKKFLETVSVVGVAAPVVGLLLGGIYWFPAVHLTKGREPWLTLLLAAGLAITVFGFGCLSDAPLQILGGVWVLAVCLLLVQRRVQGALDRNVERFGMVHVLALIASFAIMYFTLRHSAPTRG